jgi:hypothetical protein
MGLVLTRICFFLAFYSPSMVKRGGGVVDIRPRVLKYDRSKYVESVDLDEHVSKYEKIDLDELVTRFDKTRVYPAGYGRSRPPPHCFHCLTSVFAAQRQSSCRGTQY